FDLIELGPGDCSKSVHLLRRLQATHADFTYVPIDISAGVIESLAAELPVSVPGLRVKGLNGEYFDMLKKDNFLNGHRKVVLFLGSNLGNMPPSEADAFCHRLRTFLRPGDLAVVALDLKKTPAVILAAYNDKKGITRDFNLNLLNRINR